MIGARNPDVAVDMAKSVQYGTVRSYGQIVHVNGNEALINGGRQLRHMGKSSTAAVAESKVTGIIKSLGVLEDDLDSLNGKAGDMKKQIASKAQQQVESLLEKTKEMATKEAELIINKSKTEAEAESKKITAKGEKRLSEITSAVDENFESAVSDVVSTILKS